MMHPLPRLDRFLHCTFLVLAAGFLPWAGGAASGDEGAPPSTSNAQAPVTSPLPAAGTVPGGSLERFARVWEKIDFFGDLRFRYQADFNRNKEYDFAGNPSDDDRHTGRMRLRFGVRYPFHETLLFETRLRTRDKERDPRDDDLVMGRGWRTGDVGLDLLNLTFRPILDEQELLWIEGGKIRNVFLENPVMGGLVWDPDINPEGGAAGSTLPIGLGPLERLRLIAGGYVSVEVDRANDVAAFVAQAVLDTSFTEHVQCTFSSSYTGFNDPSPAGQPVLADLDDGNYLENGDFVSDFRIWDSFAALQVHPLGVPLVLSGEWIANTGAEINQDHGWTVGIAAGKIKDPGDFRVYYQYQLIEQDALFTPIARTDFARVSNYRGNAAGASWCFFTNMQLDATISWVRGIERSGGDFTQPRHETRFRLDLLIRF